MGKLLDLFTRGIPAQSTPRPVRGPSTRLHIVGEASYQPQIKKIAERGGELPIELRAEPENPHDPHAVAVLVNGVVVGYLARDLHLGGSRRC